MMIHGGDIYRNKIQYDFSVNGNPLGMPKKVKKSLKAAIHFCDTYPDPIQERLFQAIAEKYQVKKEQIILGNGASEIFMAYVHAKKPHRILIPVPSFFGYQHAANACDSEIVYHILSKDHGFCMDESILSRTDASIDCLFLANPNNPVGNTVDHKLLIRILDKALQTDTDVILDECFLPFLKDEKELTMLSQLAKYPNLLVVRAFTKIYGIPGVRLGYAFCSDTERIADMKKQLPEWNISVFAQNAGVEALKEDAFVHKTGKMLAREKEYLAQSLKKLGIKVYQGEANYLFFYAEKDLYEALLKENILIRDCSNYKGLDKGYYRICVKKHDENKALIQAINKVMSGK